MSNMMVPQYDDKQKFILPNLGDASSDFTAEDMADDMEGLSMLLTRAKIPGGGSTQFEIPTDDPSHPEYTPSLVGVILHNHDTCAYWKPDSDEDDDEEDKLPLCFSVDGKTGYGTPGGTCATCGMNAYGTGAKGRGKACKNMRVIYLLRSGEYMPLQLNLTPTSLKPFKDFLTKAFLLRKRASFGSVVEITLKPEANNNGKEKYSVAVFRRLYDFEGEELRMVRDYALNFKAQINAINQQRILAAQTQGDDILEVEDGEGLPLGKDLPMGGELPFVLNGDKDALPD